MWLWCQRIEVHYTIGIPGFPVPRCKEAGPRVKQGVMYMTKRLDGMQLLATAKGDARKEIRYSPKEYNPGRCLALRGDRFEGENGKEAFPLARGRPFQLGNQWNWRLDQWAAGSA